MSTRNQHGNGGWQRVTIRLPPDMLKELDDKHENGPAPNRSAVIRACIRNTTVTREDWRTEL